MEVRIMVSTTDRGDIEVQKRLPDDFSMRGLSSIDQIRKLIVAATEQALLAYPEDGS